MRRVAYGAAPQGRRRWPAVTFNRDSAAAEIARERYIAGCDGAHSIVRETIHAGFPGGRPRSRKTLSPPPEFQEGGPAAFPAAAASRRCPGLARGCRQEDQVVASRPASAGG